MANESSRQAGKMVRLSEASYILLSTLAQKLGRSRQSLVEQAIEELRRGRIFAETAIAYEALRHSPTESEDFDKEIALWDGAIPDPSDAAQG